MSAIELSRPAAVAAELLETDTGVIEHLFTTKRILLRLEAGLGDVIEARETLRLLADEVLRFCPNVTVELPPEAHELGDAIELLSAEIHGRCTVVIGTDDRVGFDAIVSVGAEVHPTARWITVNSDGWVCRVATSTSTASALPQGYTLPNPLGALGAACLGAGQAFLALIGKALLERPIEISLYTLEQGEPGDLAPGPQLPVDAVELEALLIGCGGVGNGWVYAMRRAPAFGRIEAVDHQALRRENLGPYVCATRPRLYTPKVEVVKEELEPAFTVIPRAERFRFFRRRFDYGQSYVPELVVSAVDKPYIRHDVQRLWPLLTIDLASHNLTAQVLLKRRDDDGMCAVTAHTDPLGEDAELAALAVELGLSVERLRDFEAQITEEDIAAAPPDKRPALEEARRRGRPICGHVGDLDLHEEEHSSDFTPAVPFVTAFAGIVGAAQTLKAKLAPLPSLHFQFSFRSYRSRLLTIACAEDCECRQHARA